MLPQPFTVYTLGSEAVGWKGLASLSMSYSWAAEMRTTVMASAANAVKLTDGRQLRHTRLFWTMALAAAGYWLQDRYDRVDAWLNPVSTAVVVLLAAAYLWRVMRWRPDS